MYRTILVPLDGSPFGERALPMATFLAQAMRAQLVLVRAAWVAFPPGMDPSEAAELQAMREAETYLAAAASRISARGIPAEVAVPYASASVCDDILLEIELRHADLVVMCTHGRSGLGRWIYGSVAEAVLARSPVPVLLVRPTSLGGMLSSEAGAPRLLVPLDGSAFAEEGLPHAATLARALDGTIVLVRVAVWSVSMFDPWVEASPELAAAQAALAEEDIKAERAKAEKYLAGVAGRLTQDSLRVQTVVRVGLPAEAILEEGKAAGARLVVMATHGRTGLRRMLLGSVALEVLQRGLLPVMLVHPPGLPKAG